MPDVSVVIPTYNRTASVVRAIDSSLAQEDVNVEVIVVDDASEEGIESVARSYQGDPRVRIMSHSANLGACAARNTGIEHANAKIIAFLDSDDWWLPHKLRAQLSVLRSELQVVFSCVNILLPDGDRVSRAQLPLPNEPICEYLFVRRGFIQTSSVILHRDLARRVGFLPGLKRLQDWDFYLRLAGCGAKFTLVPEVLSVHDARADDRISSDNDPEFLLDWIRHRDSLITCRARSGFMANKVAPEMVRCGRRTAALKFLAHGALSRTIENRMLAIELLRATLPDKIFSIVRRGFAARGAAMVSAA